MMFDPCPMPRVFALPCGVDFPAALVAGLQKRLKNAPPEAMARVTLIVSTARMQRRIKALFDKGDAGFLPKIRLISSLSQDPILFDLPPATPALQRRLELVQLVKALIEQQPDLAPKSAMLDLAGSLAALLAEMQGEGVSFDAIEALDLSAQSDHWARARQFLSILRPLVEPNTDAQLDNEGRARRAAERLKEIWAQTPPQDPIIIAGSTGSRGATALLMECVARLPQGALVLPGFDMDMPTQAWADLDDALHAEDHPQFRFARLMQQMNLTPEDIPAWTDAKPAAALRNKLVSLALRPAPVTDCWMREGPKLGDLSSVFDGITLLEAPDGRSEAQTIAYAMRQALEENKTVALITPDRGITRQVSAALARWNITADDSAGMPLGASPVGRFLRQVGQLFVQKIDAPLLIALLKHPLCHKGENRGAHLLFTRELELYLRRQRHAAINADCIADWAAQQKDPKAAKWARWINGWITETPPPEPALLSTLLAHHLQLAKKIAMGTNLDAQIDDDEQRSATPLGQPSHPLWQGDDGAEAYGAIEKFWQAAQIDLALAHFEYTSSFTAVLANETVRNSTAPHPQILIWGTMEARVQGADLVILAGLNEGSWPEAPPIDPWLNRALRQQAGLLLPERRIGLSAHDFQQAIATSEVWLTRTSRSNEAQTVPSRWLNRLLNLATGLADQGALRAIDDMKNRGALALAQAELLETPIETARAPRPGPQPPHAARPDRLSVTQIQTLVRNPYAIYAREILKLRPLEPLAKTPDPLLRGTIMHKIFEKFIADVQINPAHLTASHLIEVAQNVLEKDAPWAGARALWLARLKKISDFFISTEKHRQTRALPQALERRAKAKALNGAFTLTAKADRIDIAPDGQAWVYDYKTGTPPSKSEQTHFDKQLLLMAAMVENGAFDEIAVMPVAGAEFIGLGGSGKIVEAPLTETPAKEIWAEFEELIHHYLNPKQPFTARRRMKKTSDISDYDHLSRYGEWGEEDTVKTFKVGR